MILLIVLLLIIMKIIIDEIIDDIDEIINIDNDNIIINVILKWKVMIILLMILINVSNEIN